MVSTYITDKQSKRNVEMVSRITIKDEHKEIARDYYKKWKLKLSKEERIWYNKVAPMLVSRGALDNGSYLPLITMIRRLRRLDILIAYVDKIGIVEPDAKASIEQITKLEAAILAQCKEFLLLPKDVHSAAGLAEQIRQVNRVTSDIPEDKPLHIVRDN